MNEPLTAGVESGETSAAYFYTMELTELNVSDGAVFGSDQHKAEISLPYDHWAEMGRPGVLCIGIRVDSRKDPR